MKNTKDTLTIFKNVIAPKGNLHNEIKKALAEGWHLYKMGDHHEENMLCMMVYKEIALPNAA